MTFTKACFRFKSVLLGLGLVLGSAVSANAGAIRSAIGSTVLSRNDDASTGSVAIGFSANFFGTTYNNLFVNNNGNVTFDFPLSTFTPFDLSTTNGKIIAPFFADVDTRGLNTMPVTYGQGTADGRSAFAANYIDVSHFSNGQILNSFQVVLIDRSDVSVGDFDIEFNYDKILWETGTASGGSTAGLGGSSARVGFSDGGTNSFELAGSAVNGAFLDGGPIATSLINNRLNSEVLGRYVFNVRNGAVEPPNGVVPEPTSIAIFGIGGLAVIVMGRRQKRAGQR